MMSLSGKVLSEKVDALQLAFYTAPVSFGAIMPVFLFREVRMFITSPAPASTFLQAHSPMWGAQNGSESIKNAPTILSPSDCERGGYSGSFWCTVNIE